MVAPSDATAKSDQLAAEAEAAYAEEDIEEAARLARDAYALDPQAEYLFMWAQSERYSGNCDRALPLFREFLARVDELAERRRDRASELATVGKNECEEAVSPEEEIVDPLLLLDRRPSLVDEDPEPTPDPESEPTPAPPENPPVENDRQRPDPLGISLAAVGGTLLVTGGVLGSIALYDRAAATSADTEGDYARQVEREPALRWTGIGVAVVGAGLLAGGIARLVIVRKKREQAWHVAPTPRGIAMWGQF